MTMHSLGWSRFEGKDEKHLVNEVPGGERVECEFLAATGGGLQAEPVLPHERERVAQQQPQ